MADRETTARAAPAGDVCVGGSADPVGAPAQAGAQVGNGGIDTVAPAHPPASSRKREGEQKKKPAARRGRRKTKAKAKRRMVRWSAARESLFLLTLGETCNISEAVRVSGLSDTNVRRYRLKSEEFRAKWAVALREGYAKLEMLMLERALAGVEKPVWHGGKQVGTQRVFDNGAGLRLLALHRDTVNGDRPMAAALSDAEIRAAVAERLSEMNVKMGGAG